MTFNSDPGQPQLLLTDVTIEDRERADAIAYLDARFQHAPATKSQMMAMLGLSA